MFKRLLVILITGLCTVANGGEPDNFSARLDKKAVVMNEGIERTIDTVLELAVKDYSFKNSKSKSCDRQKMLELLDDSLDRNLPTIYHSIYYNVAIAGPKNYREVPYPEKGERPYSDLVYSPSVKVQSHGKEYFIGIDKIDHFFSHGATYYEMVGRKPEIPEEGLKKALELGHLQEAATWGLQRTKVKSYGDLSANYHGMFFWRDLFDGQPAFLKCENGKFILQKKFKVADYFHPSMDESLNCSSFANEQVASRIEDVNKVRNVSCPMVPADCQDLQKSLPALVAKSILHPKCRTGQGSTIEAASPMTTKDVIDVAQGVMGGGGNFLFMKLFGAKKEKEQGGVR